MMMRRPVIVGVVGVVGVVYVRVDLQIINLQIVDQRVLRIPTRCVRP